jgi:hypothetical protein
MKKSTKIATLTLAILLVGSIAYAADKRKQARQGGLESDQAHEEEALRAELLAGTEDRQEPARTKVVSAGKAVDGRGDVARDDLKPAEQ